MAMLADTADRPGLIALFAFNLELARIPDKVSEVILGQMRLQGWRDALTAARAGKSGGFPLATSLVDLGFPQDGLELVIDAREQDLLRTDPPRDMQELKAFAAGTGGQLGHLAIEHLGRSLDVPERLVNAAEHAGTAFTLVGLARSIPFHWPADRHYIPAEFVVDERSETVRSAARAISDAAQEEINAARRCAGEAAGKPSPRLFPALAAATIAESHINTLRKCGYDPADPRTTYRGAGAAARLAWRRFVNRF